MYKFVVFLNIYVMKFELFFEIFKADEDKNGDIIRA